VESGNQKTAELSISSYSFFLKNYQNIVISINYKFLGENGNQMTKVLLFNWFLIKIYFSNDFFKKSHLTLLTLKRQRGGGGALAPPI